MTPCVGTYWPAAMKLSRLDVRFGPPHCKFQRVLPNFRVGAHSAKSKIEKVSPIFKKIFDALIFDMNNAEWCLNQMAKFENFDFLLDQILGSSNL